MRVGDLVIMAKLFSFPASQLTKPGCPPVTVGKGEKRKSTEGEKNGSEELVEKKVCKGFQTI